MRSTLFNALLVVLLTATAAALVIQLRKVQALQNENAALRSELQSREEGENATGELATKHAEELNRLRGEVQDVARLRSEVTQLRATAKDAERLRAENEQLRGEQQQLRSTAAATAAAAPAAAADRQPGEFPRDAWSFAGYTTPESALVSAIWAMREGNPKTYHDSLSPEEQARMASVWENKSEAEVAAKHQSDVANITSIRVLDRQEVSPHEVTMSVYIGGVDRMEKVSMKKVGDDWKFGGFIRGPTP